MSAGSTDWLALPGKKKRGASVEAAKKLPHEHIIPPETATATNAHHGPGAYGESIRRRIP